METTGIAIQDKRESFIKHDVYEALVDTLSQEHTLTFHSDSLPNIVLPERLSQESIKLDTKRLQLRGESGHHVFSCDLVLPQNDGTVASIACLAKRHEKPRKGETEFRNTQRVIEKGIRTIDPIAFIGNSDISFVFLKFEPSLRSADTINWNAFSESVQQSETVEFLEKTAQSLAELHAKGIFHYDTYLRNVSYQKNDASVYFFDWEKAHIYTQSKAYERDAEFIPKAGSDLGRLFESCCREDLLQEQSVRERAISQFEQLVLTPYRTALHRFNPNISGVETMSDYAKTKFVVPPPNPHK